MGHVTADNLEEAWKKLNSAENFAESGRLVRSLDVVEDSLRDVEKACRNIVAGRLYDEKNLLEVKINNMKSRGSEEIEKNEVLEVIEDLRASMETWKVEVENWLENENIGDSINFHEDRTSNDYIK